MRRQANERQRDGAGYPYYVLVAFLVIVALSGGASRADAVSQLFVRLGSIAVVVVLLISPFRARFGLYRPAFLFAGAVGLLIIAQLAPLPPTVWQALSGREFYGQAAEAAGIAQPWRPLNLSPDMGWNALLALLPALAALTCLAYLPRGEHSRMIPLLLVLALTSALLGVAQLAGGPATALRYYAVTNEDAPVGLFANRNHHALLLAISLPMLAAWANRADPDPRDHTRMLAAFGAVAFFLIMILVIGSRAGLFLGTLGLLGAIMLWTAGNSRARRRRWWIITGVLAGVAALIAMVMTFERAEAIRRLFETDIANDPRARLTEPLIEMIRAFMPAGSGFGSFDAIFRRFEPVETLTVQYVNQAHNDLAQIAIEGGVAALLLLGIFLWWWSTCSWRLWSGSRADNGHQGRGRLGSIVTLVIMLASLVDYPLRTPLISVIFIFGCGWMLVGRYEPGEEVSRARASRGGGFERAVPERVVS